MFNWHKTFAILPYWKRGKKDGSSDGEVVLTHMKKLIHDYDSDPLGSQSLNGDALVHNDTASDCPSDGPVKESSTCGMVVSDPLQQLKRLYKFESEDSGVEMPSGANSPSTPKGSEKSFVMHSRDSSCDSGVLSASSSPTVGHIEINAGTNEQDTNNFLSDTEHCKEYTDKVKDDAEDQENTIEDFIDCQEEEELDLPPCSDENDCTDNALYSTAHSSAIEEDTKVVDDFYKDTFEEIQGLHQLKRSPTSDSLDEYMDECCRLSEVNQGASKALGSGLGYLEHICQLIEKIGQLQEHNLKLQKQIFVLQKEDRMKQMKEEYFGQHCSCGAANILLSPYQETKKHFPARRNRPHSMFVQSGNQSDLSMIPEIGINYEKFGYKGNNVQMDGWRSPNILGVRKPFTKLKCEDKESKLGWDRNFNEAFTPLEQDMKKLDLHPWGRVRDLLKKTKKNQNKLGLSSASLKRSCPQLYRPDIVQNDIKKRDRNSMIVFGQNVNRENPWSSLYGLNRKDDDM
ncbi:PREDICTED: uncharacterized protein LOC108800065 [Nanorana parkeri]|uniref:uncharacterized protein LOC108800065 n=1 Tax=Nanorana parkeri TaxID=125878 RepID=UPI000854CA5D|nr:PREDICTED: uncharacterized protein LOC108800065 [Nanorana parkeri]